MGAANSSTNVSDLITPIIDLKEDADADTIVKSIIDETVDLVINSSNDAPTPPPQHKGRHVFLDFINYYNTGDLETCCANTFQIMQDSLKLTKMRNMHSKMVVLKEDTEEGFTSVILLDESHITCHSYTNMGLLALDVFTCGATDPEIISKYIKTELMKLYPDIICTSCQTHKRFIH